MRRVGVLLIATVVLLTAAPAGAEVTQAELTEARAKVTEKSAELEEELAVLDSVLAQQATYELRIASIEDEIVGREREITLWALAAREQARAMYVSAGGTSLQAVVSPEGITRLGTKTAYLDAVVDVDVDVVNQLVFLQQDFAALSGELTRLVAQQEDLAEQVSAVTSELMTELGGVNDEYQVLYSQWQTEEAERQRRRAAELQRQRQRPPPQPPLPTTTPAAVSWIPVDAHAPSTARTPSVTRGWSRGHTAEVFITAPTSSQPRVRRSSRSRRATSTA